MRARRRQPRPAIGVTGNGRRWSPSWWCIRCAIWLSGGRAVRISVRRPETRVPLAGLVVSGGDDVDPALYGEETAHSDYDRARDALEVRYIKTALAEGLPLLGICRGMQLINIVRGGTLYLDINGLRRYTTKRPLLWPAKPVRFATAAHLGEVMGAERLKVNSLHHQAVREVGIGLRPVAFDNDHFVQAIEAPTQPIFGVQWHPEYLLFLPSQLRLFRWLIKAARGLG